MPRNDWFVIIFICMLTQSPIEMLISKTMKTDIYFQWHWSFFFETYSWSNISQFPCHLWTIKAQQSITSWWEHLIQLTKASCDTTYTNISELLWWPNQSTFTWILASSFSVHRCSVDSLNYTLPSYVPRSSWSVEVVMFLNLVGPLKRLCP